MSRYCPAWCLLAAVLVFGPVALRVVCWERQQTPVLDVSDVKTGEVLFKHEWQPYDPLCNGGDGLGPVFNAKSCVACHNQGGVGGSGDVTHNVTTFLVMTADGAPLREGVVHAFATSPKYLETLQQVDPSFPAISQPKLEQIVAVSGIASTGKGGGILTFPSNVRLSQRNTPSLFGAGLIDTIPDRVIIANERQERLRHGMATSDSETMPVGRALRLGNGQIGRFGWKAHTAHLAGFVQAACANELGLGNPGREQPQSLADSLYKPKSMDLTQQQCDQLTAFVASLPRPQERPHASVNEQAQAVTGKALFTNIGCANCHSPNLGSVEGIYSDLLLHRMGPTLEGGSAYYGVVTPTATTPTGPVDSLSARPLADEWRTPPLWGVADSAPYLHDGRAATLADAITMHGGQGASSAQRFERLSDWERQQVLAFLRTLRAP
jgi:CxxC motif-containing protein (DUF1111 family)